jgi:hypothetical protein
VIYELPGFAKNQEVTGRDISTHKTIKITIQLSLVWLEDIAGNVYL